MPSSFGLLRSNVKLTGNLKITVDSTGNIYLNSIDANQQLADSKFKRFKINPNNKFSSDVFKFFRAGDVPSNIIYDTFRTSDDVTIKKEFAKHYEQQYNYGLNRTDSSLYPEAYSMFAPIWLTKQIPKYFIIFRNKGAKVVEYVKNPEFLEIGKKYRVVGDSSLIVVYNNIRYGNGSTFTVTAAGGTSYLIYTGTGYVVLDDIDSEYNEVSDPNNLLSDQISPSDIVAIFDLSTGTNIGKYLSNHVNDKLFNSDTIRVNFNNRELTYNGIDINTGVLTNKSEDLSILIDKETDIIDFDEHVTLGFERNKMISSNLLNLEFLFNDTKSDNYTFNRYFGFYCDDIDVGTFFVDKKAMFSLQGAYRNNYWNQTSLPFYYGSTLTDEAGIKIIPDVLTNTKGFIIDKPRINSTPSIYYIKDKYNGFHKLNNSGTSQDYVLNETEIDSEKLFGFNEHIELAAIPLKQGGKSSMILTVESTEFPVGYKIQILYRGTSLGYVIADDLANVTEPYGPGDNIDYFFYPTGTIEEITSAMTKALDYILSGRKIDAINLGNQIVLTSKYFGVEFDQFELLLLGDEGLITLDNDGFRGGSRTSICRVAVDKDLPIDVTTSSYLLTDQGYCKIRSISLYNDEPVLGSSGQVVNFTGIEKYKVLTIVNENEKITIKSGKVSVFNEKQLKIGVFSLYDLKDFDFDFLKSSYSKSYTNEYAKYFKTDKDKVIINDTYSVFRADGDPVVPYIVDAGLIYTVVLRVIPSTSTIVMGGDVTPLFVLGYKFGIYDSTDMDGVYTVASASYNGVTNESTVVVSNDFTGVTADGSIGLLITSSTQYVAQGTSYRILAGNPIVINNKYLHDDELKKFIGFNTLNVKDEDNQNNLDILDPDDLKNKNLILSFNQSLTEYDRLKETQKSKSVLKSKVIPYINKWILENGKNIRDVDYRLNLSRAFGELNFSPSFDDEIQNPQFFTHEWLYISSLPEGITDDDLIKSTSYFSRQFEIDRLKDQQNDYFSEYFTIDFHNVRTAIPNQFNQIEVPTQRRYTTFKKNADGTFETFFRGAKVKLNSDIDYTGYKFAAILNFKKTYQLENTDPIQITIVENSDFKNITLVVDIIIDDYKVLPDLTLDPTGEYLYLYVMKSLKRWENNLTTIVGVNQGLQTFTLAGQIRLSPGDKFNVDAFNINDGFYTVESTSFNNILVQTTVKVVESIPSPLAFGSVDAYQYGMEFEYPDLQTLINVGLYKAYGTGIPNTLTTKFRGYQLPNKVTFANIPNVQTMKFKNDKFLLQDSLKINQDGGFGRLIAMDGSDALMLTSDPVFYNATQYIIDKPTRLSSVGGANENDVVLLNSGIAVVNIPFVFAVGNYDAVTLNNSVYNLSNVTWFHEFGGLNVYENIAKLLSFAAITELISQNSNLVQYKLVSAGVITDNTRFTLEVVRPARIDRNSTLTTQIKNITLPELPDQNVIDYENIEVSGKVNYHRYNGSYNPKFKDVLFFKNDKLVMTWGLYEKTWEEINHTWYPYQTGLTTILWVNVVNSWNSTNSTWNTIDPNNINQNVVPISKKLYDLNTKFDISIDKFGILEDFYHHKVTNLRGNLLVASNPIYQNINEIAIDKVDLNVFSSDWEAKFYKKFRDKANFDFVFGSYSMSDIKAFIGTKLLQIESLINISTYNNVITDTGIDDVNYNMGTNELVFEVRNSLIIFRISFENVLVNYIYSKTIDEFKRWVNDFNTMEGSFETALKKYITDNILKFFKITEIKPMIKKFNEGSFPLIKNESNELILLSEGYAVDKNIRSQNVKTLEVIFRYNTAAEFQYSFNLRVKLES